MEPIFDQISLAAEYDVPVLLLGETGTGKELVARAIHDLSRRRNRAFVPINTGALAQELVESELFGHKKGAFTGAETNRVGAFQHSHLGTLFLDEVSTMVARLQVALLRVIESHVVTPLGAGRGEHVDVRLIAATNSDLRRLVEQKKFREDLLYRLEVFSIHIPPLRMRLGDVTYLAERFLELFAKKYGGENLKFSSDALSRMEAYSWPGNVRELKNIVERACISRRKDVLGVELLPPRLKVAAHRRARVIRVAWGTPLAQVEKVLIARTLEEVRGVLTKAARLLGISEKSLRLKLRAHGLDRRGHPRTTPSRG